MTETSKEFMISELQRLANANGGNAPGRDKYLEATAQSEYRVNKLFGNYSDLVRAAGLAPNALTAKIPDDELLNALAMIALPLGRMPTLAELRNARHEGRLAFNANFIERFGKKSEQKMALLHFCSTRPELATLADKLRLNPTLSPTIEASTAADSANSGHVYLMRSGKHFKIGKTNHVGRRHYDLAIQLPEKLQVIHEISTDDPEGIENYWHLRFADKRLNGEWFNLTATDVSAFKRRKFM